MTNKLTAKLSDGREFEVVNDMPTAEGSENRVMWLKPLKKEPREWWFVHASGNSDPYCFFDKESEARDFCDRESRRMKEIGRLIRYEVSHVREVVADGK
jgi:hypothetical protein